MTDDELKNLLEKGESQNLEWKSDWPSGIIGGSKDPNWDKGRGELLKDLISLANSSGTSPAHLIIGVYEKEAKRIVTGISKHFDDAVFQQWATNTFDPPPTFQFESLGWKNKFDLGVFSIQRIPRYPHVVKKDLGGIIFKGQVWHRKGTQNNIALYSDLEQMFKGVEPFKISKFRDPMLEQIEAYYKKSGRETDRPLLRDKDSYLYQGYEPAIWPIGSRRVVWIGARSDGTYEHILLLKPKK